MLRSLRPLPTLLRVGLAEAVAYRAEFVVWLLSTNMPLVMLALWSAVAREAPVGRFGQADFVAYYLATLVVRLMTGAWVIWELNFEIRQGTLSFRLLRPVHPLVAYAAENVAAVPLRLVLSLPVTLLLLRLVGGTRITRDPLLLGLFPVAVVGAWLITFLSMAIVGALAFWIDSATSLFEIWMGLFGVLSDVQMGGILAKDDAGQFGSEPDASVCDALVHAANVGGGPDNITVILVRL